MSMFDCQRCGSGFDDYEKAEKHAEAHLLTVDLTVDGIERLRIVRALNMAADEFNRLANSRSNAGPARKPVRDSLRNSRNDYRLLASQIKKADST